MGICFSWFLSFYSVFLLKFLSKAFWLFSVSRFEKQQKYPFNPKQENKGNFWYIFLWRAQASLCFGASHLVEKELSVLFFVAVSPANLVFDQFLCLWKTQFTHSHKVGRDNLDVISKVTDEEVEAPFMGFLPVTAFIPTAHGLDWEKNGAPLWGTQAERVGVAQFEEGSRETSLQPFSP